MNVWGKYSMLTPRQRQAKKGKRLHQASTLPEVIYQLNPKTIPKWRKTLLAHNENLILRNVKNAYKSSLPMRRI